MLLTLCLCLLLSPRHVLAALDAIPQQNRESLWNQWTPSTELVKPVEFSPEEQSFIQAHPVLHYSTLPDAPPLEFCNGHGQCIGLTHDYMRLFEQQTGIRLEHVPIKNRAEKLESLREGRCDFLPTFSPHDLSDTNFLRTDVYLEFPLVIATRIDVPYVNTLNDLAGHRVGLVARIGVLEDYRKKFPGVDFVSCPSVPQGLRDLSQGNLFGVIGPQPVVAHQIQELYLGNLKIAGQLDESLSLCGLIRPDFAPLQRIFNKVLASITPDEQTRMLNRWFSIRFERGFDYRLFWKVLAVIAGVLLLLFVRHQVVVRYNRRLKTLNRKLEQSLREREQVMSVISHDLRQPLYGHNRFLNLLQQGSIDPASDEGQRTLQQARHRGEQAIECMENLLTLLAGERSARRPTMLSPYMLVEDCRELLAASLEQKNLTLENRINPELKIQLDERRSAAVLRNLLNNAIKFSHPDTSIEVEVESKERNVRFRVCDHGVGMNEERIQEIMSGDPVESLRGTCGERGSGMGLQICRHFLHAVGSVLEIASVEGQGTCVSFVLEGVL
jgi:polar amino acid transport system substrate-binding protein